MSRKKTLPQSGAFCFVVILAGTRGYATAVAMWYAALARPNARVVLNIKANIAQPQLDSRAITTMVTKQGAYRRTKMMALMAEAWFQSLSFCIRLMRSPLSSVSVSPREYAVPSVEIITSFAATPPIRAM